MTTTAAAGSLGSLADGRYRVLEVLGAGGQGDVVKALDTRHGRTVAIKLRRVRSKVAREKLVAEAGILLGIDAHPNLPLVREDFFDGDRYALVMDWVEGADLQRILDAQGDPGLGPSLVLAWLRQIASALDHLHGHHPAIVHGDVKPANCVLSREGRIVLVDFGVAQQGRTRASGGRRSPASGARTGAVGTPGYAAPEASADEATTASDIYGLAATATALLTGGPPSGDKPNWSGLVPATARLVQQTLGRSLSMDPARRAASAEDLVERLRAAVGGDLPTGVVSFLATEADVAPSAWADAPDATAAALARHDRAIAAAVDRHGGRLVRTQGDGESTLSVFPSASLAVSAAVDVQEAVAFSLQPDDAEIRVRTAVHTGEAQLRDGDYTGPTLGRVARLRTMAGLGHVLLSDAAAAAARDELPPRASLVRLERRSLLAADPSDYVHGVRHPSVADPGRAAAVTAELSPPRARHRRRGMVAAAALLAFALAITAVVALRPDPAPTAQTPGAVLAGVLASSPRGVIFRSDRDGYDRLYVLESTSGTARLLSDALDVGAEATMEPAWSPDGTRLAFTQFRSGNPDIYVGDASGGEVRRLTSQPDVDSQPDWSHDGAHLVFTSRRAEGEANALYVMDVATGDEGARRAVRRPALLCGEAAWSPDGASIAFTSNEPGADRDIYIADATGTDQAGRRLTTAPGLDGQATWSPDGTKLAFVSDRSGTNEVWILDVAAGESSARQVTALGRQSGGPQWSRDGAYLLFQSDGDVHAVSAAATRATDTVLVVAADSNEQEPAW